MTKSILISTHVIMVFLGTFGGLCAAMPSTSGCERLSSAPSGQLVTFLDAHEPQDRDEPYCTEFALLEERSTLSLRILKRTIQV